MRYVDINCAFCKKSFTVEYGYRQRKFCSHICSSEAKKGVPKSPETIAKMKAYGARHCIGRKLTPEHIAKATAHLKKYQSGPNHWAWRGGVTPKQHSIRFTRRYAEWRTAVFERDNFTCQICSERGGKLNADHYPLSFRELFYKNDIEGIHNINNGRTLCESCHRKTPNYGIKGVRICA